MENNWQIESFKNLNQVEISFEIHGHVLKYLYTLK